MSGSISISMEETERIVEERGKCWEFDFSKQFPIAHIDVLDGKAIVAIGAPHLNYQIWTHLKNQKMDGESTLISDKKIIIATLTFVDGIANGPCTLYDKWGSKYFVGSFVNGYRQGRGKEYDEKGNLVYDGCFDEGKRLVRMAEMSGYWKKYDDSNQLISVCRKDSNGENDGLCYYYDNNGEISKLSEWYGGIETPYNGYIEIYDEPHSKWIEGYYENGRFLNMARLSEMDGYWLEYDEGNHLKSICKKDRNGRYEGICYFYENDIMMRISEWHEGREQKYAGYIKLYDKPHNQWIEGYYNEGQIMRLFPMRRMTGYWKEMDENNNLIHICEIDKQGKHSGICYNFENDVLKGISRWEEGIERIFNGYFKYYDEKQYKWIEGYYENGRFLNMARLSEMDGYWLEYDEGNHLKSICKKDQYGRYEGICCFYENNIMIRISEWHEGREISTSGYCEVYDQPNHVWYEGGFENGVRNGKCIESNEYADVIYEGYYINGNKLIRMRGKKHFWKEIDGEGNTVRLCQIDENGKYDGLSYMYINNEISRVSQWEEGIETEVLKTFRGKRMTEYKNGKKRYEGEFIDSFDMNYQREGIGEEYDNDGKAMIYEGGIKNGKRNGHGILYKNMRLEYEGEWIMGLKKSHYYTYMALILAFMIVTASACFYFVNGYVGAVVSGVFLLAVCFYWNKKAGIVATGLLIVGICYFLNLYAGIISTTLLIVTISFFVKVEAGIVVTGLVVIGISYMFNTFVGIFTSGLLAIYIVHLIVHYRYWGLNIVFSSAGVILGICIIISLLIGINQNGIMKYLLLLVIGLFLIYVIYLIAYYLEWEKNILYTGIVVIILSCIISGLIIGLIGKSGLKYALVFGIGSYIVLIIYVISLISNWEIGIIWIIGGVILGICTLVDLILASFEVSFLKYLAIGVIGIGLIVICFAMYWDEDNKEIAFTGVILIVISCIMSGLIIGMIDNNGLKYALIFGIGTYVVFIIYVISAICQWEMKNVWISGGVILGICTFVSLILGSFEVSFLKYVVIGVIGIGLIVICFVLYWDEDTAVAFTGAILIIISCIMSGLIIGLIGKNGLKYALVFGIGSYIVFIMYVISAICGCGMKNVWISGGVILGICTFVDLILASFEVSFLKYLAIGVIGIGLIVICLVLYWDEDTAIVYTGATLIIISCIMSGLIIGLIGKSVWQYALIFGIGSYTVLIIYVISIICLWKMKNVWISGAVILVICTCAGLILRSFEVSFMKYVAIGIIGLGLIVLCFVLYWDENNKTISFTCAILITISCIMSGLIIGLIGKSGLKHALIFGIGSYIVLIIFVVSIMCKWKMENVWTSEAVIIGLCTFVDLILASFEKLFLNYLAIVIIGIGLIFICDMFYGSREDNTCETGFFAIVISCIMSGLIIGLIGNNGLKYALILGIGSMIVLIIYVTCLLCEWEMKNVWISGAVILGLCTAVDLMIGLFEVSFMKYIVIGIIGLVLIIICFVLYWDEDNKEIAFTGTILIIISCILSGIIIGLLGKSVWLYVLIFGIGSYIVLIIFVICANIEWEMKNVWTSGAVTLGICTCVDLILGSFEVSFLEYLAIGIIGLLLIVICFVLYWDEDTAIVYTGAILIIMCCIMSGLIIGLIGNNGLKYALVFGIGSYIVFIIYVICIICKWKMKNVWISGGVIFILCTALSSLV